MEREIQLQHDIHNSLDRISEQLRLLEKFNEGMSKFMLENNIKIPDASRPYIFAEYIKTHIKTTRESLNKFYQSKPPIKD